jgi:hypothetical protein
VGHAKGWDEATQKTMLLAFVEELGEEASTSARTYQHPVINGCGLLSDEGGTHPLMACSLF